MSSSRVRPAPVVAIDGPAGAGKSTVSRRVAEELGYALLDTGALYRCVGLRAGELGIALNLEAAAELAYKLAREHAIRFVPDASAGQRVLLEGRDVTEEIRTPRVSQLASQVSAIMGVRDALLDIQRDVGRLGRVVVEGRDIGTVVFPDAEAKFFLTASTERRAERRFAELHAKQQPTSLSQVTQEVAERDSRDSSRPVAPMARASDAVLIDSTELDIDEVVRRIVQRVRDLEANWQTSED